MPLLNYTTYFDDTNVSNNTTVSGARFDGWVITCELWESLGIGVVLPINPEHISINTPIRAHSYDAAFGKAAAFSLNLRRTSHIDTFNLQLTFNTGYIIPKWSTSAVSNIESPTATSTLSEDGTVTETVQQNGYNQTGNKRIAPEKYAQTVTNTAYAASRQNELLEYFSGNNADGSDAPSNATQQISLKNLGIPTLLYDPYVPPGVQNLYALLNLLDAPKTWRPDMNYTEVYGMASPNRIKVYSNSLVFPSLTFYCNAAETGISWTESAETPTSFDVTLNLLCTITDPQLGRGQLDSLISEYKTKFTIGTLARFSAMDKSTYRSSAASDGTDF